MTTSDDKSVNIKIPRWALAVVVALQGGVVFGAGWVINLEYRVRDTEKIAVAFVEQEKAFNALKTEVAVLNSNVTNLTTVLSLP